MPGRAAAAFALPSTRPRGLLVANIVAQLAFGLLAMTICLPSMPAWGEQFGAGQAEVQLSFSGYVLAYGSLQLLYGPLSDRFGRRRVLLVGLGLAFAGSVLAALAPTMGVLIAARTLQGAGAAAGMVIGRALVQDLFDGSQRTRVMAWIGMVMGVCPPLAAVVGGQLHVRVGWQANFVLIAVLALLLSVAAWRGLPDARPPAPHAADGQPWWRTLPASYARLAHERAFLLYVAILCSATATFYTFLGGTPLVLGNLGVGPDDMGWYLAAIPLPYIVGNYLTSRLVHRVGEWRVMAFGQVLALTSLLLTIALALAGWRTPLALALPLMVLGVGHGLLMPTALSGTVGVLPALAGAAAAVAGVMQQAFGATGAWVVGLVPHQSALNLGLLMLGSTLLGLLAQALLPRDAPPRRS